MSQFAYVGLEASDVSREGFYLISVLLGGWIAAGLGRIVGTGVWALVVPALCVHHGGNSQSSLGVLGGVVERGCVG